MPQSLQTVLIDLDFSSNCNEAAAPAEFLTNGIDVPSGAIRQLSTHLTTLAINLNHISPALFWDPGNPFTRSSSQAFWPNLTTLDIRAGLETAAGDYCMQGVENYTLPNSYSYSDSDSDSDSDPDLVTCTHREYRFRPFDRSAGDLPYRSFRFRPETEYFDTLAVSIARAAFHMPKLMSISLYMTSAKSPFHDRSNHRHSGLFFRAGNGAIKAYGRLQRPHFYAVPSIDCHDLETPRSEWVFQCPFSQLHWEEPEEAKTLWRARFPDMIFDIVTHAWNVSAQTLTVERQRDGDCDYDAVSGNSI